MHVIQNMSNNVSAMLKLYDLIRRAPIIVQRGSKVKHVRDVAVVLRADQPVITNFRARQFNLNYAKKEWLWYLTGDKMDDSIMEHAKMWQKLQQDDGSFYSNYGQYIFSPPAAEGQDREPAQFDYVIDTLVEDPGSRRASMMLLQKEHLFASNKDVVCTYAINFGIDNGYLEMTVMMRSNDVIFGFTNDAFCFWNLYAFVYTVLKQRMPDLKVGTYTHMANSMHAYEKHFPMLNELCIDAQNGSGYTPIQVPPPTFEEVCDFINKRDGDGQPGSYTAWLKS